MAGLFVLKKGMIYPQCLDFGRICRVFGLALAIALLAQGAAPAFAQEDDQPAACKQVQSLEFPAADQPTEADQKALKGCDPSNLYYGIGVKQDYAAARKCAFIDPDGDERVAAVNGYGILAMIYANGYGVKKNLDLALQAACNAGGAKMEVIYRADHLQELKTLQPGQQLKACKETKGFSKDYCSGVFDICDDMTSGYMEGVCAAISSGLEDQTRHANLDAITKPWPQKDKDLFAGLTRASKAYFENHAANEIDLSGTARAAEEIDAETVLNDDFLATLKTFESQKFPDDQDFAAADKKLNSIYTTVIRNIGKTHTTITKDGIRTTQRSWIAYRDAWAKFAAGHYPALSPPALEAMLTNKRIKELKEIFSED